MQAATEAISPFLRCRDAALLGQTNRELSGNPGLQARFSTAARDAQGNQDLRDAAAAAEIAAAETRRRIAADPNRADGRADSESDSDSSGFGRDLRTISDEEANVRMANWTRWQHDTRQRIRYWSEQRGWH